MELTKTQELAVKATGKNILVSAGAGTGKTRVLVERFLHFVTTGQVPVTEILALTFTEKAANEMKSRIHKRLAEMEHEMARRQLESAYISTIHAFAARLLKEHPIEAGVNPDFRVIEAEESDFLKDQALDEAIEADCKPGSETFELLRVYGESTIRKGLGKILNTARNEGKSLAEFFWIASSALQPPRNDSQSSVIASPSSVILSEAKDLRVNSAKQSLINLFDKLKEKELAADWKRFAGLSQWNWEMIEDFKNWFKPFSRRGGKTDKDLWKEAIGFCQKFLALRLEEFLIPWREKLEKLALRFEALYEARKKEGGFLDFEDLQIKALQLLKKPGGVSQKLLARYRQQFRWILVDEFQDTSPLQIELIELLSSGNNLFFVGDYKQSIYGFRGAEPAVFLSKEREYQKGETGVCIPLLENFRTEEPVLDFINLFFKNLWEEDHLPFEDLISPPLASPPQGERVSPTVELLVTQQKDEESLDHARLREAAGIAQRIRLFHEEENIPYGDMAILFQAMTSVPVYEQALKKEGIPFFVVAGRGFYYQSEIRDMMSFLAHLENPLADIPLAAVLRSPFFQIKDDTLFWLAHYAKKEKEEAPLFEAIKQFEFITEILEPEKEKLRFFYSVTQQLLIEKDRLRLTELLERIVAMTSYELIVLADTQGVRKYANIKKLISLAREYESRESLPIGAFLRMIKRLETREIKESEAQVETEKSGRVVRLLTIHKAKGLEFPVVFIADMARRGQSPESNVVMAEAGRGYSMKVFNEKNLDWEKPFSWQVIDESIKRKENEEWKRLFYVAMTRAKSKLVLSSVCKEKKREKQSYHEMSSWMEWIMGTPEEILKGMEKKEMEHVSQGHPQLPLAEKKVFREAFPALESQPLEGIVPSEKKLKTLTAEVEKILAGTQLKEVPVSKAIDLPVSAYAAYQKNPAEYRRIYEIGYSPHLIPLPSGEREGEGAKTNEDRLEGELWQEEEEVSAADFGTAMHRVLERLDFKNPQILSKDDLHDYFRGMEEAKIEEAFEILKKFLQSALFRKLKEAKIIKRELPFILNERHGLVHGVIDLLYQDKTGDWHILDYKTAVGRPEKIQEAGYDLQIQMYALASGAILKKVPATGTLYFLKNQWEYRMKFTQDSLKAFGDQFRQMQQEVIDFRNKS